ncbi:hypothetical protein OPQ81_003264 [Rhizoctonia solani]|nr:hypothetical protein OPQ81_003264 [Rhizoctonia solani]
MPDTRTQSPQSWVHQWEAAGTHLAGSSAAYLNSCLSLSSGKVETGLDAKDLVSRIDCAFESLFIELEQQIAQSRWTLARARNKLAGTFYSIPEEILAEIFTLVVYDRSGCEIEFMEDDVRAFYQRLHSLIGVCTVWRKVGMSHGALWTLIPMISRKSGWQMRPLSERSYERAGSRQLHLVASIEKNVALPYIENISGNFGRFRSINVVFENKMLLSRAIRPLFKRKLASDTLSELSLYRFLELSEEVATEIPEEHEFLTNLNPSIPFSTSIDRTAQSLRVLRMKNVHIHWQLMTFPNLVELRIESVMIGTKAHFRKLLSALYTAPQLQKLELISLGTEPDPEDTPASDSALVPIPLPNLQRLYLGDLYADDAKAILLSITPASYHLSLYLTVKMTTVMHSEEAIRVGLSGLMSILQGVKVDTLLLQGDEVWENWIGRDDFRGLLLNMPFITTLKIDYWEFGQSEWTDLTPTDLSTAFAKLHHLQFSNLRLKTGTTEYLQRFLSSHPIQHLTWGGVIENLHPPHGIDWEPMKESDQIVDWLRSTIPNFRLLENEYIPPEFRSHHWQLW